MIYSLCMVLILIGLYGVIARKNMVKIVMCFFIMEYGINLFFILLGYRLKGIPPVAENGADFASRAVDPLPQAMVLASIVVGLSTLILMVAICIRLYERYGTFDIAEIRKLKG